MRSFWALPLRRQVLVVLPLLLVPVLLAAAWSGLATMEERRDELGEQARIIARTTAVYINRDLVNQDQVSDRVAKALTAMKLDPLEMRRLFDRVVVVRAPILRLSLVTPEGSPIADLDVAGEALDMGSWPAAVVARKARIVEPMRRSPSGRLHYVVLAYPVFDADGGIVAALGIYLNLHGLRAAFESLALPVDSIVTLVDADGRVLVRSADGDRFVGQSFVTVRGSADTTPRTPYESEGLDGVRRIYGEAAVPSGPWVVSVGMPARLALQRAASLWVRSSSILLFGVAAWLMVALFLSHRLVTSVAHLDKAAKRIADGDYDPVTHPPMSARELTDLQTTFKVMLDRFNDSRQALDAQMAEERQMRRELESLQGQVIRQERLAAVGQLVSGVAHEINNPLQAILGFAELLQMRADVPEAIKGDLRLIQKESARACGIIRNLAMFARQAPGEAARLRLGDIVGSVVELRQRRLESEDIRLVIDDRSSQSVNAVMTELQQVVLNFVVNAEQSIIGAGQLPGLLTIRVYDRDDNVVLEVEDNGPGVPAEHEAKLFEPFFTTKPVGQGTGLGLSVSYGIIDSLRGHIGYRRSVAGGSVFYFELPAARLPGGL